MYFVERESCVVTDGDEFYPTFGRTDVAAHTSSVFLDGHGKGASKPWRAPPISWNSTRACIRYRQHSVSSHAARQRDLTAGSFAVVCNMLLNALTFWGISNRELFGQLN